MPGLGKHAAPWLERFWMRVEKTSACWLWNGGLRNGYGVLSVDGVKLYAHRLSFEIHRGPIPADRELDHLCRNRRCLNPEHLDPVTHQENVRRGDSPNAIALRNRLATGRCINNHDASSWDTARELCRDCHRVYRRTYYQREKARGQR